jgi:hypothetical protein
MTPVRDPANRFRGLALLAGAYMPGMVMDQPPPVMGDLAAAGEGLNVSGWTNGMGHMGMQDQAEGERKLWEMAVPAWQSQMNTEAPSSGSPHHHHLRRRPPHHRS